MADTNYALQRVVERARASTRSRLDRPAAGKTGTSSDNRSAWFVGYTPQLATAVALYNVRGERRPRRRSRPSAAGRRSPAASFPVRIWTTFMEAALEGAEVVEFAREPTWARRTRRPTTPTPTTTTTRRRRRRPRRRRPARPRRPSRRPTDRATGAEPGCRRSAGPTGHRPPTTCRRPTAGRRRRRRWRRRSGGDGGGEREAASGAADAGGWPASPGRVGRRTPADPVVSPTTERPGRPVAQRGARGAARPACRAARSAGESRRSCSLGGLDPVLVSAAMLGLAALARTHCRATGWASPDQFTHACYSDIPATVTASGLADRHGAVPRPGGGRVPGAAGRHGLRPVGLAVLAPDGPRPAAVGVRPGRAAARGGARRRRGLRGAAVAPPAAGTPRLVAASPVLLTSALVSLDLRRGGAGVLGGLVAFSRRRPVLAGVAARPGGVVRPLARGRSASRWRCSPCARAPGRPSAPTVVAAAAHLGRAERRRSLALSPEGWGAYWASLWSAPAGYGSLWLCRSCSAAELGVRRRSRAPGLDGLIGAGARGRRRRDALARMPRRPCERLCASRVARGLAACAARAPSCCFLRSSCASAPPALRWLATLGSTASASRWIAVAGLVVVGGRHRAASRSAPSGVRALPARGARAAGRRAAGAPGAAGAGGGVGAAVRGAGGAALARPAGLGRRVEAVYATCTWLYLYGAVGAQPRPAALAVRCVVTARAGRLRSAGSVYRAVQLARRPQVDPVRAHELETDDPAAGELEDAPDALVVHVRLEPRYPGAHGHPPGCPLRRVRLTLRRDDRTPDGRTTLLPRRDRGRRVQRRWVPACVTTN